MKREEDRLQIAFMQWVRLQYPKFRDFLFHIPNGGKMSLITGSRLKAMGVKPGVADVLFMFRTSNFGGLWLEFKTPKGKQSVQQKEFEELSHVAQYDYQLVRTLDEAMEAFKRYLKDL
jgi:hypothetical protein